MLVQEKKLERYYEAPWDFYFFNEIDRIFATNYIPTIDDALACKRFTVGIHEHSFNVDGMPVSMIDVGGRRKERIMWSKGMEGANAVIFIASLTDYNRVRQKSLRRFVQTANLTHFETAIDFAANGRRCIGDLC